MMTSERMRALWKISVEIDVLADIAADFAISQFGPEADDEFVAKSAETQALIDAYTSKDLIQSFLGEYHEETRRRIKAKLAAKKDKEPAK